MKKIFSLLILIMMSFGLAQAATRLSVNRGLYGFTQIENYTAYDIHYYEADDYRVNVIGYADDLTYLLTTINNGILCIREAKHVFRGTPYIEIYCPKHRLARYNGYGAGNFIAKTVVNLANAIFNLTGSGNAILGTVVATTLDLVTSGSGNIRVNDGRVSGMHNIEQKGSGRVTFNGSSQQTKVVNSGSGNTKGRINTQDFNGQANGSGDIRMKGQANNVYTQQSGTGRAQFTRQGNGQGGSHPDRQTNNSGNNQSNRQR